MRSQKNQRPLALTIAGFDPSGGAGVIADIKTFAAFNLEGVAAITSITFQNTERVFGTVHQSGESVRSQVMPLIEKRLIACAKTGMLPTREVVLEVARLFRENDLPRPVVDPVIMSSSGYRLMEEDAVGILVEELFPLARVITPNVPEAEVLAEQTIHSESDMRTAAARLREMGARAVLIKGGHLPGDAIDLLDDEGTVTVLRQERVVGDALHGSGCVLSAAIAAGLGKGMTLEDSVSAAKSFVLDAISKTVNPEK